METKYFSVSENFTIFKGSYSKKDTIEGSINYISASAINNGITGQIDITEYFINKMTISCNGSVGYAFYQDYPFVASTDIHIFEPLNKELNKYIGIYLASQFTQLSKKYTYGMKLNLTRFKNESIPLPTSDGVNPDWDYMEQTVKKLYNKQKKKAIKVKSIQNFKPEMKEFSVSENFTIFKGSYSKKDTIEGSINYISASAINNGITGQIDITEYFINKMTISCNGSVGYAFYQDYPFVASTDIHIFEPLNKELNKYIGIYLASQFTQLSKKYTYGMKLNLTRFKTEFIPLPCTPSGEIDWDYMENVVKNAMGK